MSAPTGVFLSAVTSEFGQARDVLAGDLRTKGFDVTVQEDFRQEGGTSTTLEKLDDYIRRCEAVVCVIGERSGSVPPPDAADKFAAIRPAELERASYTQWELIFALYHGKSIFVYHASATYEPDKPEPSLEDELELQQGFVHWLFETKGVDRNEFADTKDLQILVLKTELGTVRGVRRVGGQSESGLDVGESRGPSIRRKDTAHAHRLPQNRHALVGRVHELADVVGVIEDREPLVMLVGEPGVGKRTILQELTHRDDLPSDFRDGAAIHPAVKTVENLEDLRQAIWEEFYDANDPSTVKPRDREAALRDLQSLIFFPDADGPAGDGATSPDGVTGARPLTELVPELLDEMPGTVFCITAEEHNAENVPGEPIPIDNLTSEAELLALFEVLYKNEVPVDARPAVVALCVAKRGNPGDIDLLARDARKAGRRSRGSQEDPLIAWAAELAPPDQSPELAKAMKMLHAVGTDVPRGVAVAVLGSSDVIDEAIDDGRLEEGSPRYRLNPVLADNVGQQVDAEAGRPALMLEVFHGTIGWALDALNSEIFENRSFVVRMLQWGVDSGRDLVEQGGDDDVSEARGRWSKVITLGQTVEAAMALSGRHGAWEQVLQSVEGAARSDLEQVSADDRSASPAAHGVARVTDDPKSTKDALGWALHQLGSRALLRDELKEARTYLNKALQHRAGTTARDLTRKNLMQIPLAIVPFAVLVFVPVLLAAVVLAVLNPFDDSAPTIDISPDFLEFETDEESQEFRVENAGDGPVEITSIDIVEAGDALTGFQIEPVSGAPDDSCKRNDEIPKDGFCTIRVRSDGSRSTALLEVKVSSRTGLNGDQSAVLVSEPEHAG